MRHYGVPVVQLHSFPKGGLSFCLIRDKVILLRLVIPLCKILTMFFGDDSLSHMDLMKVDEVCSYLGSQCFVSCVGLVMIGLNIFITVLIDLCNDL